jgi:hypothetical protein
MDKRELNQLMCVIEGSSLSYRDDRGSNELGDITLYNVRGIATMLVEVEHRSVKGYCVTLSYVNRNGEKCLSYILGINDSILLDVKRVIEEMCC